MTSMFALASGTHSSKASEVAEEHSSTTSAFDNSAKGSLGSPWGDWNHYHNYTEIVDTLLYLNNTYSSVVDVFSIGKSWQNRTIYCIRLTNETNTQPKPKVFFVGYHHAREPITAELTLYFAVNATSSFGTNETITRMLNDSEIYVVPALNVDGFSTVKQNEWQRKNAHPFDEDNDSRLDEDPPCDVDGDGYVEDLFYWDGTTYYFIRWEGNDTDSDGQLDWIGGVDLNRNYGYQWNATCQSGSDDVTAEDFRGLAPFSEPETKVIRDLALQHNFRYAISFHSGADLILYPWGYTYAQTPHNAIFREIAGNLSSLTGASYRQSAQLYTSSGIWDDWMYGNRSAFALTCEIYENNSAWQYEPGPEPNTWWERGITQAFNPDPTRIMLSVQRWLPLFTYITNRAINETSDVAITGITPQYPMVRQGKSMNINVTVMNQGLSGEIFNVTLYANMTSIASQAVILQGGASANVTFMWNTIGFAKGNYNVSAVADVVPGETDTIDNAYAYGDVGVTWIYDPLGDNYCGIDDIFATATHFATEPDNPNWSPIYDLNDDNFVGIDDIFQMAQHFAETDP
jgi:hypothetical protein